jgi:hypothetical protein
MDGGPAGVPGEAAGKPVSDGVDPLVKDFSHPDEPSRPESATQSTTSARQGRKLLIIGAAAVVVVAVIVAAVFFYAGIGHPAASAPTSETLEPAGWSSISLPYGQFAQVAFITHTTETLTGSSESTDTITGYVMNYTDFEPLVIHDVVVGYQYTTGEVWHGSLNDTIPAGSWYLVFLDTQPGGTSGVAAESAFVLTPT